ncbi:hypothetical protein V8J82_18435 [Gymnodinialimonas sp. 2305UL16-5]|uniref:hypothetical protein n=1 Tax=Gymnodinialimonas mytili TaxID=3126503 RepID=UPI0030A67A5A
MLNFIGAAIAAVLGAGLAWRRGGNRLDMAQYAAVFALIGFVLGTILMFIIPAPT